MGQFSTIEMNICLMWGPLRTDLLRRLQIFVQSLRKINNH